MRPIKWKRKKSSTLKDVGLGSFMALFYTLPARSFGRFPINLRSPRQAFRSRLDLITAGFQCVPSVNEGC